MRCPHDCWCMRFSKGIQTTKTTYCCKPCLLDLHVHAIPQASHKPEPMLSSSSLLSRLCSLPSLVVPLNSLYQDCVEHMNVYAVITERPEKEMLLRNHSLRPFLTILDAFPSPRSPKRGNFFKAFQVSDVGFANMFMVELFLQLLLGQGFLFYMSCVSTNNKNRACTREWTDKNTNNNIKKRHDIPEPNQNASKKKSNH